MPKSRQTVFENNGLHVTLQFRIMQHLLGWIYNLQFYVKENFQSFLGIVKNTTKFYFPALKYAKNIVLNTLLHFSLKVYKKLQVHLQKIGPHSIVFPTPLQPYTTTTISTTWTSQMSLPVPCRRALPTSSASFYQFLLLHHFYSRILYLLLFSTFLLPFIYKLSSHFCYIC